MVRRSILAACVAAVCFSSAWANGPAPSTEPTIDADTALAMLKDGNERFVRGESTFPNLDQDRRCLTTDGGQHPYVSILSCADSRVPPELIFDAGIGELFAIRVAGNVADTDEIGTIEYGAGHLKTPLIVVMGHTKCGAVTAVVKGAEVHGSIPKLVDNIAPAVETAREKYPGTPEAKFINLAIKENVRQSMADLLRNSEEIRELVAEEKVKIVGAVYDIHNGTVEWLGELPNQTALLEGAGAEHGHDGVDQPELVKDAHAAAEDAHGKNKDAHAKADNDHASASASESDHKPAKSSAHTEKESDEKAVTASKRIAPSDHDDDHTSSKSSAKDAHGSASKKPSATAEKAAGHSSSHDEPQDAHGEKTSTKKSAHGDEHSSADEEHGSGETEHDAHGEGHASSDEHGSGEEHGAGDEHGEHASAEKQSLVQKHGLLVPGAFLAAGSVLSGTVVFLMKGRGTHAAAAASHAEEKPAAKPAEKKDAH